VGTVGDDEIGRFFIEDLKKSGIKPLLNISKTPSGIANAMISKDGERTFGTYLGASIELSKEDISEDLFNGYDIVYVEGYLVQNHDLLEDILKKAKNSGAKVALDLASYNVVEDNLEFLRGMVEKYVDIVFANEEESKAFTGKEPEEALDELASLVDVAVVKIGSRGSLVKSGGKVTRIGAEKADVVDTTGAGDIFAAGFLYGYVNKLPFSEAGRIGAMLAARVISDFGAKLSQEDWKEMKKNL
jgi:sugar/nucleoside kinase (ribokinase family)